MSCVKSSSLAGRIRSISSKTIRDDCYGIDDAELLLEEAKSIIIALEEENIDLCKACGDDCPVGQMAEKARIKQLEDDVSRMSDRIRELDAENDQLTRINKDLNWQLGVSRAAYNNKIDHILELAKLSRRLYEALDLECPTVAGEFRGQVDRWMPIT